jgi:hypothetical protein
MLYSEIMAVCCQIHARHINTLCVQHMVFFVFNLVVVIVTTGLKGETTA